MADIKQVGIPNRHTQGCLGDIYTDADTGLKYECVSAYTVKEHHEYEWEPVNARMTKSEVQSIVSEQLQDTIIDKETIKEAVEEHLTNNPVKAGVSEEEIRAIINESVGTEVNAYLTEHGIATKEYVEEVIGGALNGSY